MSQTQKKTSCEECEKRKEEEAFKATYEANVRSGNYVNMGKVTKVEKDKNKDGVYWVTTSG